MPKPSKDKVPQKLLEKSNEQEYARVIKVLGGGRFLVRLNISEKEVIGRVRGLMRKKKKQNFVSLDSVVLVSFRDFQDNNVDILHVYDEKDIRTLKKSGKFIEDVKNTLIQQEEEAKEEVGFVFDEI